MNIFYLQRRDPNMIILVSCFHVPFFFISTLKVVSFSGYSFISSLIFHCRKEQYITAHAVDLAIVVNCVVLGSSRCSSRLFLGYLKGLQLFLRFDVSQKRPEARAC